MSSRVTLVHLDTPPQSAAVMPVDVSGVLLETLSHMPDGVLLMDDEWRIIYANNQARRISRLRPEHLHGKSHWELYPATVGTEIEERYRRVMQQRVTEEWEFYYPPFQTWFRMRAFPAGDGIALHYTDITEVRQAEEERRLADARVLQIMDAVTDAVFVVNRDWLITYMNDAARVLTGAVGEVIGRNCFNAFPGTVYEGSPYVQHYFRAMNEGVPGAFDSFYGEPLNVFVQIQVQPSREGIVVFVRDVTQVRRDELALRESEEKYRLLAELGLQEIWTGAPDGRITYANQRFLDYIGPDLEPKNGDEWIAAFFEEDRPAVIAAWTHSVLTGEEYNLQARLIRHSDGAARWWHLRAQPLRDEQGAITMWLGVAHDVHESRTAAERLRAEQEESERQRRELEAVYDTAPVGLVLFEPKEFRYLRVNQRQAEIIGLPAAEILGRRFQEVATTEVTPRLFARVAQGESFRDQTFQTEFHNRPGEVRSFNVNYSPVFAADGTVQAISAAVLEITQLQKAEVALRQSEKLAAVGRLAASISHEINNPLEAVTNLLYLTATEPGLSDTGKSYVRLAQDELNRVSQIATQTLRFHRQADRPTAVSPAQLVDPVLNLYSGRLINSGIHVEPSYATARKVLCFENDIRQVLNNLIANAIDAMRSGGRLIIRAHDACDEASGTLGVRIVVADTGHGMGKDTVSRLFEPFYTTKGIQGNGLGLWISLGIVERHKGHLRVRSSQDEVGHGTVFSLFLPQAD